jgi:4-hydroxybenzoate polyprenyltransferase
LGVKEILEFIKIEHTLFSLPFVFIGAAFADGATPLQLFWILIAAIGARGLAMALNRIIDKEVDAANPRTAQRHLASGTMPMKTALTLSAIFLAMLIFGAWKLNIVALQLAWIPVLAFFIYPFLKRKTWACHLWLGVCLGLAPAGAWLGIVGSEFGLGAITEWHWLPEVLFLSFGVMLWITAFDFGYSIMDIESDLANGIHSFSSRFGIETTVRAAVLLTVSWMIILIIAQDGWFWVASCIIMAVMNIFAFTSKKDDMKAFQTRLFRTSVSTGWVLLLGLVLEMQI